MVTLGVPGEVQIRVAPSGASCRLEDKGLHNLVTQMFHLRATLSKYSSLPFRITFRKTFRNLPEPSGTAVKTHALTLPDKLPDKLPEPSGTFRNCGKTANANVTFRITFRKPSGTFRNCGEMQNAALTGKKVGANNNDRFHGK